jgi:DNA-directed RNA polymerase III subunit RPC7
VDELVCSNHAKFGNGIIKEGEEEDGVMDEYEEDDPDEEMDEGTDYINSYFDNGENYLDEEDDNLDDGPIY